MADLLKTPIRELSHAQLVEAMRLRDEADAVTAEANKNYVPRETGRVQIISDHLEPTMNPATGKHYDSKSRYYQSVKDAGCHVIEKDSRPKRQTQERGAGHDVKRAYEQWRDK